VETVSDPVLDALIQLDVHEFDQFPLFEHLLLLVLEVVVVHDQQFQLDLCRVDEGTEVVNDVFVFVELGIPIDSKVEFL